MQTATILTLKSYFGRQRHMKQTIIKHPLKLLGTIAIMLTLFNCALWGPTEPNMPFSGEPYPFELNIVARKNQLLLQELGKLPELQDGISYIEASGLKHLAAVYKKNPAAFDTVFLKMYQIGLPDIRKYCTPLQAIYWLFEEGRLDSAEKILKDYSLETLLDASYKFVEPDYEKSWSYLKRWSDFNTVADRLNAPQLIDYYEKYNFRYDDDNRVNRMEHYYKSESNPLDMFNEKKGNSDRYATFTVSILKRAGYNAWEQWLVLSGGKEHVTAMYKKADGIYVVDRAFFRRARSSHKGPYKNLSEALMIFKS